MRKEQSWVVRLHIGSPGAGVSSPFTQLGEFACENEEQARKVASILIGLGIQWNTSCKTEYRYTTVYYMDDAGDGTVRDGEQGQE